MGYSRALVQAPQYLWWFEVGYDVAYQLDVSPATSIAIQSARLFAGLELKPYPSASATFGVELLTNLVGEDQPTGHVSPLNDNRVLGRAELLLRVAAHGQVGVRLRARYDSAPAPRPPPPGTQWEPGYLPLADRFDTTSELVFVYSFL